ncbi:hypothetical protein ACFV2B_15045 [Streptomyces lavendulae]|uniref:hypothetical protein n=1 Tax=Streptomyces lavendulae TaxID=1914 RepID=UPI00367C7477
MAGGLFADGGEHEVVVAGGADLPVDVAVEGGDAGLGDGVSGELEGGEELGVEGETGVPDAGAGRLEGRGGEGFEPGLGVGDVQREEFGDGSAVEAGGLGGPPGG